MANIRSVNEIILSLIDFYKLAQPNLDTKPGTVARDLFVDGPASQLALLYDEIVAASNKQSFSSVIGTDLDKLGKNFGQVRRQSTISNGIALFTFSAINATININKGATVTSNNGLTFSVTFGTSVNLSSVNYYKSVANKFRDQLDMAGISDQYAVEVSVSSTSPGSSGNIPKAYLSRTNVSGVSNVTNINPFVGGTDQESDAIFRARILSAFSGSSVGTSLGYQSIALNTSGVSDVVVVEPGNSLMTRDGTEVSVAADGTRTILSEGSGGKVDVVVLGSNLTQVIDTFIYKDKSNNNDPTNSKNNVILGQISGDEKKTINRRRTDNIANGTLPNQPVSSIISVTGSESGSNFKAKSVDAFGNVSGNYEFIKDTGYFGGSPFGFDTFHWISNKISDYSEEKIKGQPSGQDSTTFSDVLEIPKIQQTISITNENSTVTFDRSIIQLLHAPSLNVTRVFNVNTGERYLVSNQNYDSTGSTNTTGRIQISGSTLPSPSDVLQVDYSWLVDYDQYSDYDGLSHTSNPRLVADSIDWGYSSMVKDESVKFDLIAGNNFFLGTTSLPINTVISAKSFLEVDARVFVISSGLNINRLAVSVNNLLAPPTSVDFVKVKNKNIECYNTSQNDGMYTVVSGLSGITTIYNTTVILPKDTFAASGDKVTVVLNSKDVFGNGTSSDTKITIPSSQITTTATSLTLKVTYVASNSDLFSSAITSLPASKFGNGFNNLNNVGDANYSITNIYKRENSIVQLNGSNQLYVNLSILVSDYTFIKSNVLSVIRISDNKELWNSDNLGTIITGPNNTYQLVLSGYNTPLTSDRVLVIYSAYDTKRFQPFTFQNVVVKTRIDTIDKDTSINKYFATIADFTAESGLSIQILEPNTDIVLLASSDGLLSPQGVAASLTSSALNFGSIVGILNKKVRIYNANNVKNNGTYDIVSYDSILDKITLSSSLENLSNDQVSVIRLVDGKECWTDTSSLDFFSNKLLLPIDTEIVAGDKVFITYYSYKNLKKSPTKLISTTIDQVINGGTLSVSGSSITKATDIVFTSTSSSLKLNITEAVRKSLSLLSTSSVPSTIKLVKIAKLEKVTTASANSDVVVSVQATYDVRNSSIANNQLYSDEFIKNVSLSNLEFILPPTLNNKLNGEIRNLPALGDKFRITFYYTTDSDTENLSYTKNGNIYSNKKFAIINKIFVSSGFKSSQSTRLSITSFTQPSLGARYRINYDYVAPKQNERISVGYIYNKLISDLTFNLELARPINADVIARVSKNVPLDLVINVVIADSFKTSKASVLQNLKDKLNSTMTTNKLNGKIDTIVLINAAASVSGIARARVVYFNRSGKVGTVSSINLQQDEYYSPNNVTINTETR